ncbi:MAG: CBS domain-containing protein [Phototrophicales bacterium]|nr:CBS domain-containing protein [Phototrophicales bacterium]
MLKDILVKDYMSNTVISVTADTPITQAHQIMKKNNIRRLPVMDNNNLEGMVTIGDVREASPSGATTLSIWELNYLWSQIKIGSIMSKEVLTVRAHEPIIHAAKLMYDNKVSGLPVLDEVGRVIGVITESDIFRMVIKANL